MPELSPPGMDEQGNNRRVWFFALGGVSILIVGALVWIGVQRERAQRAEPTENPFVTRLPVPANTHVPEPKTTGLPEDVAIPSVVAPANPFGTSDLRAFSIRAEQNAFSPNTIIVQANDVAKIAVTAVDRDYDFTQPDYGITELIARGETKIIAFVPTAEGKFAFYCSQCGETSETRARGSIIVVKR